MSRSETVRRMIVGLLKVSTVVLLAVIGVCSPENVHGNGLRCSCELDNVYSKKMEIHCGKTTNGVSTITGDKTVSCEKDVKGSVPLGYRYLEGFGLFKIHRTVKNYSDALQFCEFEGASLFVPETPEEVRSLDPLFKDSPTADQVFIGINDIKEEGNYVTLQGVPLSELSFQRWRGGQPDNYGDEDCLTLSSRGELNDANCSSWQCFLCKRNVSRVPRGYEYVEGLGFYKVFHEHPATYAEARRRCQRDGGHLCVPDTYHEADLLVRLYDRHPEVREAWVGITDIKEEGDFVTETGKPLTTLQFQNWGSREPNSNNPKGEDCVCLHQSGVLADYNCEERMAYTCEIPLDLP